MRLLSQTAQGEWIIDTADLPDWENSAHLLLEMDAEPDASQTNCSAIGVNFPAFNDGRGLSLAVLLRGRLGFSGDLIAIGEVHEDIIHYLVRCGFNKIALPDRCSDELALKLVQPYSQHYQASVTQDNPSFKRVERGISA
jgi:uncharacterized protein (DUF934 family)